MKILKVYFFIGLLTISFLFGFYSYHQKNFLYDNIYNLYSLLSSKVIVNNQKKMLKYRVVNSQESIINEYLFNKNYLYTSEYEGTFLFRNNLQINLEDLLNSQSTLLAIHNENDFVYLSSNNGHLLTKFDLNINKIIWEKNYINHHWGDTDSNYLYVPSRKFIDLPKSLNNLQELDLLNDCPNTKNAFNDTLLIIDKNTGELFEEIDVLYKISQHEQLKKFLYNCKDPLHLNFVRIIKNENLIKLPKNIQEGDILLSFRSLDSILIIDRKTHDIKYYLDSLFHMQHSPIFKSNGNLIVFDNFGSSKNNGMSRILEINPSTKKIVGIYDGSKDHFFQTNVAGLLTIHDNKIFVVSSEQGEIFYIDCEGAILNKNCEVEMLITTSDQKKTAIINNYDKFNDHIYYFSIL